MKNFWATTAFFVLIVSPVILSRQISLASEPAGDSRYNNLAQEAERNRELLEIWKDHVKTLTKERDTAYKELEQLKVNGPGMQSAPVAQFGGIETQTLPSPEAMHQIENLQSEVSRLQAALEQQPKSSGANAGSRELQMQFGALQSQLQQVRKELNETRVEKDRLIQEKEKALSQVDRMKSGLENAKSAEVVPGIAGQDQAIADNLQKALNIQKKRYEDLKTQYSELESEIESLKSTKESGNQEEIRNLESKVAALSVENQHLKAEPKMRAVAARNSEGQSEEALREAREIQYENETLKARIEKLQVVEKELASAHTYFTPLIKELQVKNQKLSSENESLSAESMRNRAEFDNATRQAQQILAQNQKLSSDLQTLKAGQEDTVNQMTGLKSQLQMATADKDKYKGMEEEIQRLSAENKTLHQAYSDLESGTKSQNIKFQEMSSQFKELQARDAEWSKQVDNYKNSLRGNLTDIKNLKSNFESYLESLVASFDERQK